MEFETQTTSPKTSKTSTPFFAIIWIGLFFICLLCFIVIIGLLGWGFYANIQKMSTEWDAPYVTATVTAQWPVIFQDNFLKLSDNWYTGEYKGKDYVDSRTIANGVYTWEMETEQGYTFWDTAGIGALRDFVVSVDARHVSGSLYDGYGLIFRSVAGSGGRPG